MIYGQAFHIEIEEESDYTTTLVYNEASTGLPVNLTGYRAELQARQNYDGQSNPIYDLTCNSDTDGGIVLGTDGTINITIPYTKTVQLMWDTAVYDLFIYSPTGVRSKFVKGFMTILRSATHFANSTLVDISGTKTPPLAHPNNFGAGATDAPDPSPG